MRCEMYVQVMGGQDACGREAVCFVDYVPCCDRCTPAIRPITEADELEDLLDAVGRARPYRPRQPQGPLSDLEIARHRAEWFAFWSDDDDIPDDADLYPDLPPW